MVPPEMVLARSSTAGPPVQQQAGHAAAMRAAAADPARPRRRDYGDALTVPDGAVLQLGGRPAQDCMSRWCSWDEKM